MRSPLTRPLIYAWVLVLLGEWRERARTIVIANDDDRDGTERGQGRFKVCRSSREETPRLPFSGNDGGGLASPRAAGTCSPFREVKSRRRVYLRRPLRFRSCDFWANGSGS